MLLQDMNAIISIKCILPDVCKYVCMLCADSYIFQHKWDQDTQHSNSQLAFFQLIIHSCSYNL